jgi:hypothetical protein
LILHLDLSSWKNTEEPPANLPVAVHDFLKMCLHLDDKTTKLAWATLRHAAWDFAAHLGRVTPETATVVCELLQQAPHKYTMQLQLPCVQVWLDSCNIGGWHNQFCRPVSRLVVWLDIMRHQLQTSEYKLYLDVDPQSRSARLTLGCELMMIK